MREMEEEEGGAASARVSAYVQLTAASTCDVQIGVIVRISARCAAFKSDNKLQPMPESDRQIDFCLFLGVFFCSLFILFNW